MLPRGLAHPHLLLLLPLLLLLLLPQQHASAQDVSPWGDAVDPSSEPNCPVYPSGTVTPSKGCPFDADLVCQRESTLEQCDCNYYVPCNLDPPYKYWTDIHTCDCQPNWKGADCSIATPPPAHPSTENPDVCGHIHKLYDGTFFNTALAPKPANVSSNGTIITPATPAQPKFIECHMPDPKKNQDLGLRLHRVNLTVLNVTEEGHAHLRFQLLSRHRNTTILHPSQPNWHLCLPTAPNLDCELDCQGEGEPGDTQVTYTCDKAVCTSCASDPDAFCSPLLAVQALVITEKTTSDNPLVLAFSNVDSTQGTGDMEFRSATSTFSFECRVGTCVGSKATGHVGDGGPAVILIKLGTAGGAILLAMIVGVACCVASRRPKGNPADAAHVRALDGFLAGKDVFKGFDIKLGITFTGVTYDVDVSAGGMFSKCFRKGGGGKGGGGKGGGGHYERLVTVADGEEVAGGGGGGGSSGGGVAGAGGPRRVLRGVTGYVQEGQMVAVMGPSGAGKSSLLNILADRVQSGRVGGHVHLIGGGGLIHPRRRDVVSYVLQDDHLMHTQTVAEALLFSARMRLSHDYTEAMIEAKVRQLMTDLRIDHIAHSRIGHADHGGGISGGERKRVAIGVELVANPRFLLLDEPTSGLDSASAEVVLRVLRKTAEHGCACVLTIHQPSYELYAKLFDNVLLVSRLGQQVYYGPPLAAIEFMQQHGHEVPQFKNPAEFVLDLCADRDADRLGRLEATFRASDTHAALVEAIRADYSRHRRMSRGDLVPNAAAGLQDEEHGAGVGAGVGAGAVAGGGCSPGASSASSRGSPGPQRGERSTLERRRMPNGWSKFMQLSGRSFRHIGRDPSLLLLQVTVTVMVAVLTGAIFYHVDNRLSGIQNRVGVLFFMILFFSIMSLSSLGVLFSERTLFRRERKAGFYSTLPYYASKLVSDMLPMRVLPPLLFSVITYWLIGLHDSPDRFAIFTGTLVLVNLISTAACFCFSASCSSVGQANLLASLYVIFSTVFGGLLFNTQTTHSHLTPMQYGSYFHLAYEVLMCNEFYGLSLIFNAKGYGAHQIPGSEIPLNYGMNRIHMYPNLGYLSAFFGGLVVLGYACLRFSSSSK